MNARNKKTSKEECNTLCQIMKVIPLKVSGTKVDETTAARSNLSYDEWAEMATNKIDIEEDNHIIADDIDELLEELNSTVVVNKDGNDNGEKEKEEESLSKMLNEQKSEESVTKERPKKPLKFQNNIVHKKMPQMM